MLSLSSHLDSLLRYGDRGHTARPAGEWAAGHSLNDTVLLVWDKGPARSLPVDAANKPGCSNHRGALLGILHSRVLHVLETAKGAANHTAHCARMIDVCSRQSTSAASLVCQWRPSASVEADTAVYVLHLHRTVARVVVTEKVIDCRSEDVGRENVWVSRPDEGYLQIVSVTH